jgi:hypothetical protein
VFGHCPAYALDAFSRLRPRTESPVKPAASIGHRWAPAARSAPSLSSASWNQRQVPRRIAVLEPSTPLLIGCYLNFLSSPHVDLPPGPPPPCFQLLPPGRLARLERADDFHYYLPPVSKAAKRLLLRNMLDRYAKFVPQDSIDPIEHLLPDNPRKLKRLVRGLVSLHPQLARHGADELNWVEIWLAEMIRQESYPFFMRLLDGDALESLIGIGYKFRRSELRTKGEDKTNDNADIRKVIDEVSGINEKQAARLIELVNATRTLAGLHLQYNFKFALRPEAVTWKEFYELLAQWKEAPVPETISAWIAKQSVASSIDPADIETDLYETSLNAKQNAASEAAEAPTIEENATHCAEAKSLLTTTEQFLSLPEMFTPERFGKLLEKSLYWIAFRVNPADGELRDAERNLIYSLLGRASDGQAPAILETLKPWNAWAFGPGDAETTRLKKELRDESVTRLLPKVEHAFAGYISRPESLRLLSTS